MSFIEFNLTDRDLDHAKEEFLSLLDENRVKIDDLLKVENKRYDNFLLPFQELSLRVERLFVPISHLNYVNNTKESQRVYNEILPVLTEYSTALKQNREIYSALIEIREEDRSLTAVQSKLLEDAIKSFELSGVGLEEQKKSRLAKIDLLLSKATTDFAQNLLKATDSYELIVEDIDDISEMPESDLEAAKSIKDGKTIYTFTLHQPSFVAFMTYSKNRELKERLYKAYTTRAKENDDLIEKILSLRDEEAKILGFKNYAELSLAQKMANTPSEVIEFLEEIAKKSRLQANNEFKVLQEFANSTGFKGELQPWDIAYYSEKLKIKTLNVADEEYMPYFEKDQTVCGLFKFIYKLFGVEFKESNTKTWHKSAKAYDLSIESRVIGRLYIDLESRKGKRGGAWMNNWITHHIDSKKRRVLPVAFIVANFAPSLNGRVSLLRPSDVVTLFHEMGHALHHLLSRVDEPFVSGINGVEWDAVEFPSQFLENFAYESEVLREFAVDYRSKKVLSTQMIERLKLSKNFQSAMGMIRQIEFSLFDIMIHLDRYDSKKVQEILDSIRDKYSVLKPPKYNKFQWGFSHIFAGGYAAGYYSYKWAEVLSADAFFKFVDSGIFNEALSKSYYDEILSTGGSRDAMDSFIAFNKERPKVESLLRLNGISYKS